MLMPGRQDSSFFPPLSGLSRLFLTNDHQKIHCLSLSLLALSFILSSLPHGYGVREANHNHNHKIPVVFLSSPLQERNCQEDDRARPPESVALPVTGLLQLAKYTLYQATDRFTHGADIGLIRPVSGDLWRVNLWPCQSSSLPSYFGNFWFDT